MLNRILPIQTAFSLFCSSIAVFTISSASEIHWNSDTISGETDVITLGQRVLAINFGSVLGADDGMLVNGVAFDAYRLTDTQSTTSITAGSLSLTINSTSSATKLGGSSNTLPANSFGLTGNYQKMINTGIGLTAGNTTSEGTINDINLTFDNLIEGHTYVVQMWSSASTTLGVDPSRMDMVFGNGSDCSDTYEYTISSNPDSDGTGSLGSWITATFIADSNAMTISAATNYRGMINAIQIRDLGIIEPLLPIPEPSVTILSVTGLAGFILRRRRETHNQ